MKFCNKKHPWDKQVNYCPTDVCVSSAAAFYAARLSATRISRFIACSVCTVNLLQCKSIFNNLSESGPIVNCFLFFNSSQKQFVKIILPGQLW